VAREANKTQVKSAVEKLFKVKVEEVRTANVLGKLRRRGKFSGYRSDWKKAYVRLKAGQKVPEFAEI
jgi:large subunit ribosomal protein L23